MINDGHPSAAGRAQDRESSPAKDRRSTTVPHIHIKSLDYNVVMTLRLNNNELCIAVFFIVKHNVMQPTSE